MNKRVKVVIDTLCQRQQVRPFVKKFIKKRGYPKWGYTSIFPQQGQIVMLVPVVRPKKQTVTGIIDINLKPSENGKKVVARDVDSTYNSPLKFYWIPRGLVLKGRGDLGKTI